MDDLAPDIKLFIAFDKAVGWFLWRTYLARYHVQLAGWACYAAAWGCLEFDVAFPWMLLLNFLLFCLAAWGVIKFSGGLQQIADQRNMAIPVPISLTMTGFSIRVAMLIVSLSLTVIHGRQHPILGVLIGFSFWSCILIGLCTTWPRRKPEPKEKRVSLKFAYET